MTKVGLWGGPLYRRHLGACRTARPGNIEALRDLEVPIYQQGALAAYMLGRLWAGSGPTASLIAILTIANTYARNPSDYQ